jgi:hypothetical protein
MKDEQITVSDLALLIAAREETRAELHLLSLEAWEHWREIEAKLQELEDRLCRGPDGEYCSGVHPIQATSPIARDDLPEPPPSGQRTDES